LTFVSTSRARSKIKHLIHAEEKTRAVELGRKLFEKGYANVPLTAPGLGIELVEEEIKKHLISTDKSYFAPTNEWNDVRSHDRPWS